MFTVIVVGSSGCLGMVEFNEGGRRWASESEAFKHAEAMAIRCPGAKYYAVKAISESFVPAVITRPL